MALSAKKVAAVRVTYETALISIVSAAKKHKISTKTIERLAKKHGWKRGESREKVAEKVAKKAEAKFIEAESDRLARFTEKHISDINLVRQLSRLNLSQLDEAAQDARNKGGSLHKDASDNFFVFQKVLKITSETLTNCYREERLAMGLDKPAPFKGEITLKAEDETALMFAEALGRATEDGSA